LPFKTQLNFLALSLVGIKNAKELVNEKYCELMAKKRIPKD